jgi:hypothetical protein
MVQHFIYLFCLQAYRLILFTPSSSLTPVDPSSRLHAMVSGELAHVIDKATNSLVHHDGDCHQPSSMRSHLHLGHQSH